MITVGAVSLTVEQEAQIRKFYEAEDIVSAQRIILNILDNNFNDKGIVGESSGDHHDHDHHLPTLRNNH